MTPEEIKRAREICDAATPGPWFWKKNFVALFAEKTARAILMVLFEDVFLFPNKSNAEFIAESRALLPKALDEIERLKEIIAYARKTVVDHDLRCEDSNETLADLEDSIKKYDQQVS